MLLHENSSYINGLLGSNVHYKVPRYQRRYVWDETTWDTLWKDILFQLKDGDHSTHFTGPIVTRSIDTMAYEVIDGQQRLATFQIILCVIRDLCKTQNNPQIQKLADSTAKYIVNDEDVSIDNTDYEFTFNPTEHDQIAFSRVISGEYAINREESDKHSILKAYNHFSDIIQKHMQENFDFEKMRRLLRCITNKFSFIHINLGRGSLDQPEKIFASINATGRKLSEFDYLRNDLFLRAAENAEEFYDNYWVFEKEPEYWKEHRLGSFFQEFLIAKQGPDCFEKNAKPFEAYQQYRERLTTKQGIKYEFQQLKGYAQVHQNINNESLYYSWPQRLRVVCDILDLPSLDPFMLFVAFVCPGDVEIVCQILQSYIVRRLFFYNDSETSYQDINKHFSIAIKAEDFNVQGFVNTLCDTWPNDGPDNGFKEAKFKDPVLISYILSECLYWGQERKRRGVPINEKLLLIDIQNILISLDDISDDQELFKTICQYFTELWMPSSYFIQ